MKVPGLPAKRAMDVFDRAFAKGVMGRVSGPTLAFAPPFVCDAKDIDR